MKLIFALAAATLLVGCQSNLKPSEPTPGADWDTKLRSSLHDIDVSAGFTGDFINPAVIQRLANATFHTSVPFPERREGLDCYAVLENLAYPADRKSGDRVEAGHECEQWLRYNYFINGPAELQKVFDAWASRPITAHAPDVNKDSDAYFHQTVISRLATHYTLFYDTFTNNEALDAWLSQWFRTYTRHRPSNAPKCPFDNPSRYASNPDKYVVDACGSNHWRNAVAKVGLGIRSGDQELYIEGVRSLELNLAMFDEDGIFVPYAARGADSPGYAIDILEYLSMLGILYGALGIDFWSLETADGRSMTYYLDSTVAWLEDPSLAKHYILGTLTCNDGACQRFDSFDDLGTLDDWRVIGQFEAHDLILRRYGYLFQTSPGQIPAMAEDVLPDRYNKQLPFLFEFNQSHAVPIVAHVETTRAGLTESNEVAWLNRVRAGTYAYAPTAEQKALRKLVNKTCAIDEKAFKYPKIGQYFVRWVEREIPAALNPDEMCRIGPAKTSTTRWAATWYLFESGPTARSRGGKYVVTARDNLEIDGNVGRIIPGFTHENPTADERRGLDITVQGNHVVLSGTISAFDEGRPFKVEIPINLEVGLGYFIDDRMDTFVVQLRPLK